MKDRIWGLFFDENTGEVCIDILNTEWSPIYTLTKILQSLISLLSETKINLEESTFLNAQAAILKQNNER
jgi:ubiquitin-protein ligase